MIEMRSVRRNVMSVRRIFVEKREAFAVKAKELREEIVNYLAFRPLQASEF